MTTFDVPPDVLNDIAPIQVNDDGKSECPDCHKRLTVTQAGALRSHTCVNGKGAKTRKSSRGKPAKDVPGNVMRVGCAAIASGVEWSSSHVVASYVPCSPDQVPAEITDADAMVGPLIKLLWPQLPAKAQNLVSALCDQEDLIVCLLAWWDYANKLRAFAVAAHEHVARINAEQPSTAQTTPSNMVSLHKGGHSNGIPGQTQPAGQGLRIGGIEPFRPADPLSA